MTDTITAQGVRVDATGIVQAVDAAIAKSLAAIPDQTAAKIGQKLGA